MLNPLRDEQADDNRRETGMLNPLRDKNGDRYRGGEGNTQCDHGWWSRGLEIKSDARYKLREQQSSLKVGRSAR